MTSSPALRKINQLAPMGSHLERSFVTIWHQLGGPEPEETEYRFHKTRRWRFDFSWPSINPPIAIEVDGGTFSGGRHTRGKGYSDDQEKRNAATIAGWRVFNITTDMLTADPSKHLLPIINEILYRQEQLLPLDAS